MTVPLLDPAALDRLRRIGGDRLLRAMLASFVENGSARVAAARAGSAAGGRDAVADAAHALKSSAGNVGATTLQLVSQKVEREARDGDADLSALVDELEQAFLHARVAADRLREGA